MVSNHGGHRWRPGNVKIEPHTADYYAQVLDQHILPALGNYYYDALTRRDVQEWVDRCLTGQWGPEGKKRRPYKLRTVRGWYRVLHNMSRDAMEELGLERDPTMRVAFPDQPPATEPKSLRPDELSRFLAEVRAQYPQHYALTATLAFTGLRFCHASALKWEDWDDATGVLRVQRKQVDGVVGALTRRKPGPGGCPIGPDLTRLAQVDAVVRRALVGHVTEAMQQHYSHVAMDEKRAAMAGVYRLVPLAHPVAVEGGDPGGDAHLAG